MWEEALVLTIGLTGGIGSGKSTVAGFLAEMGARVIDADLVGHEVYAPRRPAWARIVAEFGHDVVAPDGTIDRKKLGQRVFSDSAALRRLNAIVHPAMAEEIRERISHLRSADAGAPVVLEAAVLIEAGWKRLVDEVWVVVTSREQAIDRVVASRGLERAEVERRIENQLSDEERSRSADCVIRNTGSPAELRAEVEQLWKTRIGPARA